MKIVEDAADKAISDLVDRLVAVAKGLPPELEVKRDADGLVIEGPRAKLLRIANPTLRDLIGTGVIEP